jgi:uncharacterized membrane protein YbhN (UPF0104 family)
VTTFATAVGSAWDSLAGVSAWMLLVAVGLHLGKIVAEARAWHGIVAHAHRPQTVRFRTTCGAFVGAIGANVILPARFGESLRVALVRRGISTTSVVTVGATIVLETAIEIAFAVAVIVAAATATSTAMGGGPASMLGRVLSDPVALGLAAAAAAVGLAVAVLFRSRARAALAAMVTGFSVLRSPRAFAVQVMSWKLVAWTFRFAAVYAFLLAFHVPATPWSALTVVAAQNVAASLPLLPGNAGTQQAAIAVGLAGTAGTPSLIGFGLGMQAACAAADVAIAVVAVALLLGSRDAIRVLRDLWPSGRGPIAEVSHDPRPS